LQRDAAPGIAGLAILGLSFRDEVLGLCCQVIFLIARRVGSPGLHLVCSFLFFFLIFSFVLLFSGKSSDVLHASGQKAAVRGSSKPRRCTHWGDQS